jgi:hypothetical protein
MDFELEEQFWTLFIKFDFWALYFEDELWDESIVKWTLKIAFDN